jgi:hypothetical protein
MTLSSWVLWTPVVLILCYALFRPRRRFPIEQHSWLRCKPGTWIKRRVDIDDHGVRSEQIYVQTLKGIQGHRYELEESFTGEGRPPTITRTERENSIQVGHAPVNLPDRNFECTLWSSLEISNGVRTRYRFYTPKGEFDPAGITYQNTNSSATLTAVGAKEEVAAMGRTFLCTRLEGEFRIGEQSGRMTLWHCRDVPGSEIRSRMVLKDKNGEHVRDAQLVDVHEVT